MEVSKLKFAPLHAHSGYSLYDGFGTPQQRAERAKELGLTALAITDHGTMSGNEEHYYYCNQLGIKAIQGCETYFMTEFVPGKENVHKRRHLTLLAKNMNGYSSLCKIQTLASTGSFYIKPITDFALLEKHSEGIICLSGCVLGEIAQQIIMDDWDEACRMTERFINIYGENFFFEVQPQEFPEQRKANEGIIKLSDKFGRPCVMTGDSHFASPDDLETYLLFRKIGRNEVDDVRLGEIKQQYKRLYIMGGDEMNDRWKGYMGTDGSEYVEQSQNIADMCEDVPIVFKEEVPAYIEYDAQGNVIPVKKVLALRVKKGLKEKGLWEKSEYIDRVKYELGIILAKQGKADYFLLTADMCQFARANGVPMGPGRGSGVASLVAYALGIIDIDPLKYGLIFERFMNPERETIPDFDLDFSSRRYEEVTNYLSQRLNGKTAAICNIIRYRGDNLINDLGKALEMEADEIKSMKITVGNLGFKENQPSLSSMLYSKQLRELEKKYQVCSHFAKMFGNPRAYSQHASGIAVTPGPIDECIPLFVRGKEGERKINTAYEMAGLSRAQIVKIDVLKLDTADMLYDCANASGIKPSNIPLNDSEVFSAFCDLNVVGIFQYDSPGARSILSKVRPSNIEELIAVTALDRPGAMHLGQLDVYVNGKNRKKSTNAPSILAKYCNDTYGALVYQEQIMLACRGIAGMSWGEASKVMKSLDALPADHPLTIKFVTGAQSISGMGKIEATELFYHLTSYTFNKGHASAYATLAYWMMWYKVHHPLTFYLALLRASLGKDDKRKEYEADAISNCIIVFLPHVNGQSNYHLYEVYPGEMAIMSGLSTIPGVGGVAAKAIDTERSANGPFSSEEEFLSRVNGRAGRKIINKRVLEALQGSGALEFDKEVFRKRTVEYCSRLLAGVSRRRYNVYHK
jgi:DNA polymerase-3 subunit alpha